MSDPLRLTLQGINSHRARTRLDLFNLPLGLIAVAGTNGAGKTTAMACMGPAPLWLEIPSYPGPLTDRATRRDAFMELVQRHDGVLYRHLIEVDPGTGRSGKRVDPYLFSAPLDTPPELWDAPDTWTPVGESNGKVGTYKAEIARLFPRRDLYLASVYSVHTGAGNFLELSQPERVALFSHMLGIGHFKALATRAGDAAKPLDAALGQLQELAATLERDRTTAATLTTQVGKLVAELGAHESTQATARQAEADLVAGSADLVRRRELLARRAELSPRAHTLEEQVHTDELLVEGDAEVRANAKRHAELTATRSTLLGEHRGHKSAQPGAAQELTRLRQRVGRLGEDRRRLEARLAGRQELVDQVEALGEVLDQLEAKRRLVTATTAEREARGRCPSSKAAKSTVEALGLDAQLLSTVPCGSLELVNPDGGELLDCGDCGFLSKANAARDGLEAAKAAVVTALASEEALGELVDATLGARSVESKAREAVELQRQLSALDQVTQDLDRLSAEAVKLTTDLVPAAEARVAEIRDALETVERSGQRIKSELVELGDAPKALAELELAAGRLPERRQSYERIVAELGKITQALGELQVDAGLEEQLAAAKLATQAARTALGATREALGHARGRLTELGDLEARGSALEEGRALLSRRRAGFRGLQSDLALIPALEIDAAGPRVSELTNDLLSATYGDRFQARLTTIREASEGRKQREAFGLEVLDADADGKARGADELSKGERVLVDEALKLGVAVFRAERSGVSPASLFRDECDTGLAPENRVRYPAMLRQAALLAGVRRLFFVSHDPAVHAQADAVIYLTPGGGPPRVVVQ